MNQKVLIFHPALAPYRVDLFNALSKKFNTSIYFNSKNVVNQKFEQEKLLVKCTFNIQYLDKGLEFWGRSLRFGIRKILNKENPDVVISSEYNMITLFTFLYKNLFNKRYKMYVICDDSVYNASKRKGYRAVLRDFISKNIDGIMVPSQEVDDWFKDHISRKINTLILPVIHNDVVFRKELVDSLKISSEYIVKEGLEGKKIILFVGRLVSVKNLFLLINTVSLIKGDNFRLVIVGDGVLSQKLKNKAKELGVLEKIIFTGRKEGHSLLAWYNLADILVLPSLDEKFGAVVNEALLAGAYVLCSKRAGASSLINKNNGKVFDPNIESELLTCLKEKLQQTEPVRVDGLMLRQSKMPFTFTSIIDTFLRQLEK